MELVLIKSESPEWEYMWEWLANHPINKNIPEPTTALNDGEAWQYMGSFKNKDKVIHEFRHRNHPFNNQLQRLNLQATPDLTDDQIEKTIKI